MNSIATDRMTLLTVASATLAQLQADAFESEIVSSPATAGIDTDAARIQRDVVVGALAAGLDFARLEEDLLTMSPGSVPEATHNVPYLPSNQALALLQSALDEYLEEGQALVQEMFDGKDPRWIASAWEKLKTIFRGKHKFIRHTSSDSFLRVLPEQATVALFSDWGTGEDTAVRVMTEIAARRPTHAIHLGDVYYSGTAKEVQRRFLDVITASGPRFADCQYFALNSNHEMYSGGDAYFDLTLKQFGQEASYFNIANPHWQLIGLDSGYEDHGLQDPQDEWLAAQLRNSGPRSVLLSHHQFFSPFEKRAFDRKLHKKVRPLLGNVFAWFWGHEHKAIVFDKHEGIHARCIGHGAIPTSVPFGTPRFPDVPVVAIDERAAPSGSDGIHGFALLQFDGPKLKVSYIDEFGTLWFEEQLQS